MLLAKHQQRSAGKAAGRGQLAFSLLLLPVVCICALAVLGWTSFSYQMEQRSIWTNRSPYDFYRRRLAIITLIVRYSIKPASV